MILFLQPNLIAFRDDANNHDEYIEGSEFSQICSQCGPNECKCGNERYIKQEDRQNSYEPSQKAYRREGGYQGQQYMSSSNKHASGKFLQK